jgi:prepilin-type processing-associated H-X9-DG protein
MMDARNASKHPFYSGHSRKAAIALATHRCTSRLILLFIYYSYSNYLFFDLSVSSSK